jgi:hypothetical protein
VGQKGVHARLVDGLWRERFCPRGEIDKRAFAHPTLIARLTLSQGLD